MGPFSGLGFGRQRSETNSQFLSVAGPILWPKIWAQKRGRPPKKRRAGSGGGGGGVGGSSGSSGGGSGSSGDGFGDRGGGPLFDFRGPKNGPGKRATFLLPPKEKAPKLGPENGPRNGPGNRCFWAVFCGRVGVFLLKPGASFQAAQVVPRDHRRGPRSGHQDPKMGPPDGPESGPAFWSTIWAPPARNGLFVSYRWRPKSSPEIGPIFGPTLNVIFLVWSWLPTWLRFLQYVTHETPASDAPCCPLASPLAICHTEKPTSIAPCCPPWPRLLHCVTHETPTSDAPCCPTDNTRARSFRMLSCDLYVSWRRSGDLPGPSMSLATVIPHVKAESPETPGGPRTLWEMEFRMRRRESPEKGRLGDY